MFNLYEKIGNYVWDNSIFVLIIKNTHIVRDLSGKYRAYRYISSLALFFIIGRVVSFEVILI